MDEALKRVFRFGRFDGIPRAQSPVLVGLREEVDDGHYALVLEFEHKPRFETDQFEKRLEKIATFFGPGVRASVVAAEREGKGGSDLSLICDGSGEGKGGSGGEEILPPLMPGLPARQKQ